MHQSPLVHWIWLALNYISPLFQNELDATKNEWATQRIAFEEEKLARLNDGEAAHDSEAEALRIKLKQQVPALQ